MRLLSLTALAMAAFAANSVLCRLALSATATDPAPFTALRLVSGAVALGLLARRGSCRPYIAGDWPSAVALFVYAAAFSFAYVTLTAGTGALLLFGAVQMTMVARGMWQGERLAALQVVGLVGALAGLVVLVLPGVSAPPPGGASLMAAAGVAWGVYSLRGRGSTDPTAETAGNFLRAAPLAVGLAVLVLSEAHVDGRGALYAVLSGALTSGAGYAVWYAVLPGLRSTSAAAVQLSVPVIAAAAGVALLGEPVTMRLVASSVAVLGGIALVLGKGRRTERPSVEP